MTRTMFVLRVLAAVIALLAVIDPAVELSRSTRPEIAILAAPSPEGRRLAAELSARLSKEFVTVPGPFPGAAATVVAGHSSLDLPDISGPVFAVTSDDRSSIRIDSVDAPAIVAPSSRVDVRVAFSSAHPAAITGRLDVNGVAADVVSLPRDSGTRVAVLSFVPLATGPVRLHVALRANGDSTRADAITEVRDRRWRVLFYDSRPSWTSTFVRRAIADDPRFVVGARTRTTRGVSTRTGQTPSTLADPALSELYDVIVVGAPDALGAEDGAALDAFLRRRGGSVVLLPEQRPAGPLIDRLSGVAKWNVDSLPAPRTLRLTNDSAALKATELLSPAALPNGAEALIGSPDRAIVWAHPVGAGSLYVSGALDAWRYRDAKTSGFASVWTSLLAEAAARTVPAVGIELSPRLAAPGQTITITATDRDAILADPSRRPTVDVIAALDDSRSIRLWPDRRGRLTATFRAPVRAGFHRASVRVNGVTESAAFQVDSTAVAATPDATGQLREWANATGGAVTTVDQVGPAITNRIHPAAHRIVAYPMRSGWWLLPFVVFLAAEWWWRRRRGDS